MGPHFLHQGLFLTQGSSPLLLRWQVGPSPLSAGEAHSISFNSGVRMSLQGSISVLRAETTSGRLRLELSLQQTLLVHRGASRPGAAVGLPTRLRPLVLERRPRGRRLPPRAGFRLPL